MSEEKQSALLKILKATATLPAQVMFYGTALAAIAIASIPGVELPPALAALAGSAGAQALGSILERVARGELTEEDIRREVQAAIEASNIATALQVKETQVMVARLFRRLDVVRYAIQQNEFGVLQRLVELRGQFEAFTRELQGELANISAKLDNVATRAQVEAILRLLEERLGAPPSPDWVRAYLKRLADRPPRTLDEAQLYIGRNVARAEERDIFYPRNVTRYDPRRGEPETGDSQPQPEPLEKVLAREKKLMLLGEPGMGKTTGLQHLAWEAAQHALRDGGAGEENPIPIYAELKAYAGEDWALFLARQVNQQMGAGHELAPDLGESARKLRAWFAQPTARFLVLLDGLNEVRPEFQTAARGALEALLNSAHPVVISCRERDYDAGLRERAAAYVLQGLGEADIRDYLRRALGR
ncbi:MAG: NACHT domain-containing protein, partial [Anaerolineales bacterium]|nr:NACHT domain-containing protein [Anaerolineales bacterium]